jgi:hypothetical protein
MEQDRSAAAKGEDAFALGMLGAVGVAGAGFLGHAIGNWLHPTLTGDELFVERAFRPNDILRIPLRYSYQNRGAESGREIVVTVSYVDSNAREQSGARGWRVR